MISTYRKIWTLLDERERRRFMAIAVLVLVSAMLETLGVVSILPFLMVVSDPNMIEANALLKGLYTFMGLESRTAFLSVLGAGVFLILVSNLSLKALSVYVLNRFAAMRNYTLSARLLSRCLAQPYEWFLQRNSAEVSKTVLSEVGQVVSGSIMPAMQIFAQGVTILFLVVMLLIADPLIALAAAVVLGGSYGLLIVIFRRRLTRIGEDRVVANRERFEAAAEALGGIKVVKLLGLEGGFLRRFHGPAERMASHQATSQAMAELPRYLLEAVIFGAMILFVLVLLERGGGRIENVVPTLGLFAFAGMRLFPPMQRVYHFMNALRFGGPALDALILEFERTPQFPVAPARDQKPLRLTRELRLEGVVYGYPAAERRALEGLDMSIAANTSVGIVGGTGAGKTTAVDIILGLLEPQAGRVLVDGTPLDATNMAAWRRSLGYVPQEIFLMDASIRANIAFGSAPGDIDDAAVERAARIAELHDFVTRELPEGYETVTGERGVRLSGGQRQRIGIARALYHDPDVLVFDEATSALDNLTERALMRTIGALGTRKTVIMIAHRLSTVRDCTRIFFLKHGLVRASGTFDELVASDAEFRSLASADREKPGSAIGEQS